MNLLIVDDELMMVEILKKAIDWNSIGIGTIFTANNAMEARNIIEKEEISIMISDIEMPQENGLELIDWIQNNNSKILTIILTSYPDFIYAQDAVSLGVYQYLLKPVAYDKLKYIVEKAVSKVKLSHKLEKYQKYGEYLTGQQNRLVKDFIVRLIKEDIPSHNSYIDQKIKDSGFDLSVFQQYTMILFRAKDDIAITELGGSIWFAFENIAEELFPHGIVISTGGYVLIIIQQLEDSEKIKEVCHSYMEAVNRFLQCQFSAFVMKMIPLSKFASGYGLLKQMEEYYVKTYGDVYFQEEFVYQDSYEPLKMEEWKPLLAEMNKDDIKRKISLYLKKAVFDHIMNKIFLRRFQQDFLQILYTVSPYVSIGTILKMKDVVDKMESASESVDGMILWIDAFLERYMNAVNDKEQSVVEFTKQYLEQHFNEKLSREDIEKQVHLNQDYLNRIFKAETGYSLMEFIQYCRIQKAKQLLRLKKHSISQICLDVGYDSPPYFSKIFKKQTGMTPQEYREKS